MEIHRPMKFKKDPTRVLTWRTAISSLALLMVISTTVAAGPREQAKRIHDRLTGVPPTNTTLDTMEALLISDPTGESAAVEAMNNPAFYNVTLKNFAAPWTNEAQSVFVPLNDYSATVIGMVRDGEDFRDILSGNILYRGVTGLGITGYSNNNNTHYVELEQLGSIVGDLSDPNILEKITQTEVTGIVDGATAGIITTRTAAEAFFIDGTNRAMLRFTLINHLCTDLEQLKDISRVPDRVHRDVSRSPGGDSRIFMNNCVGCHAGMDSLLGAYANYSFNTTTQRLDYTPGIVVPKFNINANNFKYGYISTDDSWLNYWRNGQNKLLGWGPGSLDENGHTFGNGAKSMGVELANSRAFSSCQVKKVFKAICFRDSDDYAVDRTEVNTITDDFMNNSNYDLKSVFAKTAAYCKGS